VRESAPPQAKPISNENEKQNRKADPPVFEIVFSIERAHPPDGGEPSSLTLLSTF